MTTLLREAGLARARGAVTLPVEARGMRAARVHVDRRGGADAAQVAIQNFVTV